MGAAFGTVQHHQREKPRASSSDLAHQAEQVPRDQKSPQGIIEEAFGPSNRKPDVKWLKEAGNVICCSAGSPEVG